MRSSWILLFAAVALCASAVWRTAEPGYHYKFPEDHFSHPGFQTEWWYYTGNLRTADGRRFGFELTFFREGVSRTSGEVSPWKLDDVYLAHLALSDIGAQRFYHSARLSRSGPGFAGASMDSREIWNGNWHSVWKLPPPAGSSTSQTLSAVDDRFRLNLNLRSTKPAVIHGIGGISRKAADPGRASHYISFTRLETNGSIQVGGNTYQVTGASWMDHEFFTQQLDPTQAGWDWFSLQFQDQTELMLFRLRRKDGAADPFSAGTFVDAKGQQRHLTATDFSVEPLRTWKSPATEAAYPVVWRIRVAPLKLTLETTTPLDSQELVSTNRYTPTYWEGAIDAAGEIAGKPTTATGYLEMTGYAQPAYAQ